MRLVLPVPHPPYIPTVNLGQEFPIILDSVLLYLFKSGAEIRG